MLYYLEVEWVHEKLLFSIYFMSKFGRIFENIFVPDSFQPNSLQNTAGNLIQDFGFLFHH